MPIPDYVRWLRAHVGTALLWLVGAAAVVLRDIDGVPHVLLVRRSDTGDWTPVTGIVDPGEDPHATAVRECLEETGVVVEVERLVWVHVGPVVTYPGGDRAQYLEHTFRCRWVSGEGAVGDDESVEVRWWPADALPDMPDRFGNRVRVALADRPGVILGDGPATWASPGR
jgi:8-oxo-dGTP pyrophosphatase MutT (NUDIX family)